ncbi:MAG: HD domain-containing protein [Clostridia bacterium]
MYTKLDDIEKNEYYQDYYAIVQDIIEDDDFQKLKLIKHHTSSIYDHVLDVSYWAFYFCRKMNLDEVSAARAGLLHDFICYRWRDLAEKRSTWKHCMKHPLEALENAKERFVLNENEEIIIKNHMWPMSYGFPSSKEAIIVSLLDKYCATVEFLLPKRSKNYLPRFILLELIRRRVFVEA